MDLVGNKYGKLMVIQIDSDNNKPGTYWICECVCGKIKSIRSNNLTSGKIISCGCSRIKDLTGMIFDRWTVLYRDISTDNRVAYWFCKCSCGNTESISGNSLRRGLSKSCGCLRHELRRKPDEDITYYSAHERIYRLRGKASQYKCLSCGNSADEWSLSREADLTHLGWDHERQLYYSGDPNDYDPRCISCHRIYDEWRKKI